ncbi:hypothetical protein EIP86_006889 [Pleurotus ostreatoroseus]|nr:hypothetical protein EIP86_006889 [Pleurotus ostreatoroseus]
MADSKQDRGSVNTSKKKPNYVLLGLLLGAACLIALYRFSPCGILDIGRGDRGATPAASEDPEDIWVTVPLDYANSDGPKAFVALAKVPSKVSTSDRAYRGPILFNPGGPGASAIDLIRGAGQGFQAVLGEEYDVIGFDPRGVGRTLPLLNVFPDETEGFRWRVQSDALPLPNITEDAVARLRAQSIIYAQLAESRVADVAPYVTTALVCRDMLSIMAAHGRDKLQYWGFSYGSVIGATFAAMFPDRIERMTLDALFSDNLLDADKVLDWFLQECVAVGSEQCVFHASSVPELKTRLMTLLDSFKANPLPVTTSSSPTLATEYGLVDYALVMRVLFGFLTSPHPSIVYPISATSMASALLAAEKGDGTPMWNLYKFNILQPARRCDQQVPGPSITNDAVAAISCTDGDPVNDTTEELQALFNRMVEDSMFSVIWTHRARCACVLCFQLQSVTMLMRCQRMEDKAGGTLQRYVYHFNITVT